MLDEAPGGRGALDAARALPGLRHARSIKPEGEVDRRCPNASCPAQVEERLKHFARREAMDIEGLGDVLVAQLVDERAGARLRRPLRLRLEDLAPLFEPKAKTESLGARNLLDAIEASKSRELRRLLFGLGIRFVGERAAMLLARHFRSLDGARERPRSRRSTTSTRSARRSRTRSTTGSRGPPTESSSPGSGGRSARRGAARRGRRARLPGDAVRAHGQPRGDDARRGQGRDRGARRSRDRLRVEEDVLRRGGEGRRLEAREGAGAGRGRDRRGRSCARGSLPARLY